MNIELIYFISTCLFIFAIMFAFQKHRALKLRFFTNLVIKAFLKKYEKSCNGKYFSSIGLKSITKYFYNQQNKDAKLVLNYLLYGKYDLALRYLNRKNGTKIEYFITVLNALKNSDHAIVEFERLEVKNNILIELVSLYFNKGNIVKAKSLIEAILEKKTGEKRSLEIEAVALYYLAQINLKEGNLYLATENNNKAISLFEKTNLAFEYANAMLLMGLIYRFAFIEDVAEVFFKSALDAFKSLELTSGIADSYANLAMVNLNREIFETAIEQHEIAINQNKLIGRNSAIADSLNHLGLIEIIRDDSDKAIPLLNEALEIHQEEKNYVGIALSYELLAQIYLKNDLLEQSKRYIKLAIENNQIANNISALNDASYILAQILVKEEKLDESADILRRIIKTCDEKENIFPIANAYSLLGVIYLKQGNLNGAKSLLQKSLHKEMKDERIEAIACDYTNIGIIESKKGNIKEAKENWELASKLAKASEDEELIRFLNEKLKEE